MAIRLTPPDWPLGAAATRARILRAAHERYSWEAESRVLLDLYRDLAPAPAPAPSRAAS